jgi:bifunctional DNA-binding transcriptional regulator/antitoxin component of YhaV-PrlF toxin-antitoxin module
MKATEPTESAEPEATTEAAEAAEEKPKEEAKESVTAKLDRLVKEREKAKAIRREAEEQRQAALKEIEAERNKLKAELEEQRRVTEQLEFLKKNPLDGMKKLNINPEEFLERIIQSDPKDIAQRQKEESLFQELTELKKWKQELEESIRRSQEEQSTVQERQRRMSIVQSFVEAAQDTTKYPNFSSLYGGDPEYQVTLGHRAADHIREQLGYQPSREEILEYLEHEATKKAGSRVASQSKPGEAKGLPKTLGKSDLTDRKGSPVSVPEDWEERKRLAKARVKAEMKDFDSLDD